MRLLLLARLISRQDVVFDEKSRNEVVVEDDASTRSTIPLYNDTIIRRQD